MQDRLKFKLWDKKEKTMCPIEIDYIDKELLSNKNYKILQSTGLRDKNNELIHEGDIVKLNCISPWGTELEAVGEVQHDRCAYWINFKHHSSELYCEEATYEVMGNIYENPELLESEEKNG